MTADSASAAVAGAAAVTHATSCMVPTKHFCWCNELSAVACVGADCAAAEMDLADTIAVEPTVAADPVRVHGKITETIAVAANAFAAAGSAKPNTAADAAVPIAAAAPQAQGEVAGVKRKRGLDEDGADDAAVGQPVSRARTDTGSAPGQQQEPCFRVLAHHKWVLSHDLACNRLAALAAEIVSQLLTHNRLLP